jgi:HAD superfamily hydrolase (TIGR01490 family)
MHIIPFMHESEEKETTGTIGAFFDFDRTLLAENSPRLGIRYLWDRGEVRLPYVLKIAAANWFYKRDLVSETVMARLLLSFYKDRSLEPFRAGAADYYREIIRPHLASNIVSIARDHKRRGHVLVLVSAGIRYLLEPVVEDLGFDHLICTDLEEDADGRLTGAPKGEVCTGDAKRMAAAGLARTLGMDLEQSYAYGDHHADIPLLMMVGNPRAVEPTRRLKQVALEKGWPILTHY